MTNIIEEAEIINKYLCQLKKSLPIGIRLKKDELNEILDEIEEHIWLDPEYLNESSCEMERLCDRCKKKEPYGEHHPSDTGYGTYSEQICGRCGAQLDGFMNC